MKAAKPRQVRWVAEIALAFIFLCLVSPIKLAFAEVWEHLPPTPTLPSATSGSYLDLHGTRIWYADYGPRTGSPVLLLHGGPANSSYYGQLVPVLVERGFRVVAMDSRGHGRSTRSPEPLTYHLMAGDVLALLDSLDIRKVSIVGWSDGGIVGLDLAIHHPERLAKLFAFGANSNPGGLQPNLMTNPVFALFLARAQKEYRALSPTPDQWPTFYASMNKMWDHLPNFTTQELASIRVPTTIADGEHEEVVRPTHTRELANAIPGAKLVILPNVSHFALLQDPAAFNSTVLAFLH